MGIRTGAHGLAVPNGVKGEVWPRERGGEETVVTVGRLTCNCPGGAVSGDDRVRGAAWVVGGGWWMLGSWCPIPY